LHTKEALIFDDRYNGGGFIPEGMAFTIGAQQLNFWSRRYLDLYTQPAVVHTGPKAVLINGLAASGGDAFPYYFRYLGLGKLVGERTWGGLVGMSGNPGFVDGSSMSVPRFAFVNSEGEWAVEAEGVAPDIEVLDRPEEIAAGREPIIEAAVRHLLEELEKPQYQKPGTPRGPIRRPNGRN
jgi:tricorn protease